MSPQADVRAPGEGGSYTEHKGNYQVTYKGIADEVMRPKSPDSPFRDSLRVIFDIDGDTDTVSLSVTLEDPAPDLLGFVDNPEAAPVGEQALRKFIDDNIIRDPIMVYVSGFIQSRIAEAGEHTFIKIIHIYQYTNKRGDPKLGMIATTRDGLTTSWNCPEPKLTKRVGDKGPEGDYIGPLSPDVYAFVYLQEFGLDWDRMGDEDLKNAVAYWPGHYDAEGVPIDPLFPSVENPWPGFLDITARHGWQPVKMTIVDHPTYGLGPKRIAKGLVKMGEADDDSEFNEELEVFKTLWDTLVGVLFNDEHGRLMAGKTLTQDGKAVALHVLKPLITTWPDAVKQYKADGTPAIRLPPTPESWTLNGLVCANFSAERLLKLDETKRFEVVNLNPPKDAKLEDLEIVKWAKEAVPEWAGAGEDGEGELL